MEQKNKLTGSLKNNQSFRMSSRIKLAGLFRQMEGDFNKLISAVENDPLFRKLNKYNNIIKFEKFPKTAPTASYYRLEEYLYSDNTSLNVEKILENRKELIETIRKIGKDVFERYFLKGDCPVPVDSLSLQFGISPEKIAKILDLVNTIYAQNEFYSASIAEKPGNLLYFQQIAAIEPSGKGEKRMLQVNFISPNMIKGKYVIDYDKLKELNDRREFSREESARIRELVKFLELINIRKSIIYRILSLITDRQSKYLFSGNPCDMAQLTQTDAAEEIGVNPSTISRAIYARSIKTPGQAEFPISYFMPNRKEISKIFIKGLVFSERKPLSDENIKETIAQKLGLALSRRAVSQYRKELNILKMARRERA